MDRIDLLRTFVRVVDAGSFTRAADGLSMPRSTVSAAVMDLESRLGVRLLHRTTRKVSPTHDGQALYARCQSLLEHVDSVESMFQPETSGPAGKLRVDVPGRIGRRIVAPALPEFFARYPGIELELGVSDRAINLIADSVDCALRVGPLSDSGLIARKLGDL